jgi:hypothetical protein
MVVSFINDVWEPIHVNMGIFEMHNTVDANMVVHVKVLLIRLLHMWKTKGQINYLNFYFDICGILLSILIAMPICWFLFWSFHAKSYTLCYIDDVKVCNRFIEINLKGRKHHYISWL